MSLKETSRVKKVCLQHPRAVVYEGKDPNTQERNHCAGCFRKKERTGSEEDWVSSSDHCILDDGTRSSATTTTTKNTAAAAAVDDASWLIPCGGCNCVYFCSERCMESYGPGHEQSCPRIAQAEAKVESEARELRSFSGDAYGAGSKKRKTCENLFLTRPGHFWEIPETREYMVARFHLADLIYEIAYEEETVELWNKVLTHHQELLRLNASDNMALRYKFPFILLYLNRDDDAYAFCRYWFNYSDDDDEFDEENERSYLTSTEGQWMYPRENGCRYNDIFVQCPSRVDDEYACLPMLMAVLLIKLRLVAAFDEQKKYHVMALDQSPEHVQKIESNRGQIRLLMDRIDANNPTMLPSMINPEPLEGLGPLPDYVTPGDPSEAADIFPDCHRAFLRVPGVEDLLHARFGPNPTYNITMCAT